MTFSFGLRITLILLLIGGAVAIIGNYLGRAIGRRRLTLLRLRPRYTANAITVLTGGLIALLTLGVVLAVSHDARTALFGLDELRQDVAEKSALLARTKDELDRRAAEKESLDRQVGELNRQFRELEDALARARANLKTARREIGELEQARDKLGREVTVSRQGELLFKVNEVLLASIIQAGPEKDKLESGLRQILAAADRQVRSFGYRGETPAAAVAAEDFSRTLRTLQERRGEQLITVVVTRNTVYGEEVPVRLELAENRLIYQAKEEISEIELTGLLSTPEIEQKIKELLVMTHRAAKQAGVMPDASGSIGSLPYSEIFALARRINAYGKGVRLKSVAKQPTYTIGPLEIDFKLLYQ